jgi:uncharacterized protein YndB with AHSA1/START domain
MNAEYGSCGDNRLELVCESHDLGQISQYPHPFPFRGAPMADILQDFPVDARPHRVFEAVSTPDGLNNWWTLTSTGKPIEGTDYELNFGPHHHWQAIVACSVPDSEFELQMTKADDDWTGSYVGFRLELRDKKTWIRFRHSNWPEINEHFRVSCHCWAMYLRILRRYLEYGEIVPYEQRLQV